MEKKKIYIVIGIAILFTLLFFRDYKNELDIKNKKKTTTGKIIEFREHYQAWYSIVYEYVVDNKTYEGHTGVNFFKNDNGKTGAVGDEFVVYYSSKNPKNSRIDLGKYEKYKTTVEFVNID